VGACTWLASGASAGTRVLAAVIGLAVGLVIVLLYAWAVAGEDAAPEPQAAPTPAVEATTPGATAVEAQVDLSVQLDEGRALAVRRPEPAAVEAWIAETSDLLTRHRPGVAGYFAALGRRSYPDESARLEAHLARLEVIVRELS
jgi:hypothetical protein